MNVKNRLKFEYFLREYFSTKANITICARAAKLNPNTAGKYLDLWSRGLKFQDIPKPVVLDYTAISKGRYL